ncbi:MAG TPA: YncE family protein [Hyphomicrobiaceae bacterium]|nr:YncE family protein [Hyphomicrobiaceae bacterium]
MHTHRLRMSARALALCAPLMLLPVVADAQIAVSSNDNKVVNVDGANQIVQNPPADTATIIDLGVSPPRVLGEVQAPGSVVGPPQSVAIAPDESLALIVASTKVDPADPKKTTSDNRLTIINLKAKPAAVVGTVEVGAAPAGVSFSPDGKLALVANRGDGTVSILTVSGTTVSVAGKIDFGNAKAGPSHVAFTPDGKRAFVTRDGDHRISELTVDGGKVTDTKLFMSAGIRPYSITINRGGTVAVLTNQGGGQGDNDIVSVVDLKMKPPRVVSAINVGQIPEGATFSPDGKYVAVTIQNGSARPKKHPAYHDHGLVQIFSVKGTKLSLVAQAKVGGWTQGVVWSKNGKTLLAQSMLEKALDVLSFNGRTLKKTGTIKVNGGPAGIRTAEH